MSAPAPEGSVPSACYEALRGAAIDPGAAGIPPRGLRVLIGQGMAAWIRAWSPPMAPVRMEPARPEHAPAARPDVVAVLAELAWAAARQEISG